MAKRLKENSLLQRLHATTAAAEQSTRNTSPYADKLRQHAFKKADVRVLAHDLKISDAQAAQGLIFLAGEDLNGKVIETVYLDHKADKKRKTKPTRSAAAQVIFEHFRDVLQLLRKSD